MNFHEVRFPAALSVGSSGGPERRTEIVTLKNGFEERNSPWAHSRRRYDAGLGVRSLDDLAEVIAFFEARQRAALRVPLEGLDRLQVLRAVGGAVRRRTRRSAPATGRVKAFGLSKTYRSGPQSYVRPIAKPVEGTVRVAVVGRGAGGGRASRSMRGAGGCSWPWRRPRARR